MLRPDFERVAGVSMSQVEKKGKAPAALDHFDALEPEKIPRELEEAVRGAYGVPGG